MKFAQVSNPVGVELYYVSGLTGNTLKALPAGTLLKVVKATDDKKSLKGYGKSKAYKVKTRSGVEGWVFGKFISLLSDDEYNRLEQSEIEAGNIHITKMLLDTVSRFIESGKFHPNSEITKTRIDSINYPYRSNICEIDMSVYMTGSFLGIDKFRVGVKTFVEISDIDLLSPDKLRIGGLARVDDEKIGSIPGKESEVRITRRGGSAKTGADLTLDIVDLLIPQAKAFTRIFKMMIQNK